MKGVMYILCFLLFCTIKIQGTQCFKLPSSTSSRVGQLWCTVYVFWEKERKIEGSWGGRNFAAFFTRLVHIKRLPIFIVSNYTILYHIKNSTSFCLFSSNWDVDQHKKDVYLHESLCTFFEYIIFTLSFFLSMVHI